jgi:hypothetical protein
MELSLDELKELVFDFNSSYLIEYYESLLEQNVDFSKNGNSCEFIQIILDNLQFEEIDDEDDEYISD